jgi:hypothetical protein
MKTKTENELLMNLRFMKLDLDIDVEEQDMFIDETFVDLKEFAEEMLIQRQLNSSGPTAGGHASPGRNGRAGGR